MAHGEQYTDKDRCLSGSGYDGLYNKEKQCRCKVGKICTCIEYPPGGKIPNN